MRPARSTRSRCWRITTIYNLVALTDDRQAVIAGTRHAWLGRQIADVLPQFDLKQAAGAIRERRAGVTLDAKDNALLGYAGVQMRGQTDELRSSKTGSLVFSLRFGPLQGGSAGAGSSTVALLGRMGDDTRAGVVARVSLPADASHGATGSWPQNVLPLEISTARSELKGSDELGRLGRAFDAMAVHVAGTQTRLREELLNARGSRRRSRTVKRACSRSSTIQPPSYFAKDTEGRFLFANRQFRRIFHLRHAELIGKTDAEILPAEIAKSFRANDLPCCGEMPQ